MGALWQDTETGMVLLGWIVLARTAVGQQELYAGHCRVYWSVCFKDASVASFLTPVFAWDLAPA